MFRMRNALSIFLLAPLLVSLLAACGGGGGSGGTGAGPGPGPEPEPEPPGETCVSEAEGAALLACYQGIYRPEHVYLGTPQWAQLVIGTDGSLHFSGEETLSFAATDVTSVQSQTGRGGELLSINITQHGNARVLTLHTRDERLWDIEYQAGGERQGVTVAELVPTRLRHPLGQVSNGVSASIDGELTVLNINQAVEPSWANATGLYLAALVQAGTAEERAWRLSIDAPLPGPGDTASAPWHYHCGEVVQLSFVSPETGTLRAGGVSLPGRCVISLDYIEYLSSSQIDYIDGYFVAELQQADTPDSPVRVLDGFFRIDPPN